MNKTKLKLLVGTGSLVTAFAIIWSCTHAEGEDGQADPSELRGFNEPLPGAISTNMWDGSAPNANVYSFKQQVYLDGGRGLHAPAAAAGLAEGDYYFQVTDPSGRELLSPEHISCRKVHVSPIGVFSYTYKGMNYLWKTGTWIKSICQHKTGIDPTHTTGVTVQLMPYDDTPDKDGLYKVWLTPISEYIGDVDLDPSSGADEFNGAFWEPGNFHGFVPAHSKTDNFKIHAAGDPGLIAVQKFHDANADGVRDAREDKITGWEIELNDALGASNRYFTPAQIWANRGRWAVRESTPERMMITSVMVDREVISTYPDADPLVLLDFAGETGELHEILYGNVGVGSISACKVYDANANGIWEPLESGLEGAPIELLGADVRGQPVGPIIRKTDSSGCTSFDELLPGQYELRDLNVGAGWVSSSPSVQTVTIQSTYEHKTLRGTQATIGFSSYCTGSADFDPTSGPTQTGSWSPCPAAPSRPRASSSRRPSARGAPATPPPSRR